MDPATATIIAAIASSAIQGGFSTLTGGGKQKTTTPVQVPQMEQPDLIGQLMAMAQKRGGM